MYTDIDKELGRQNRGYMQNALAKPQLATNHVMRLQRGEKKFRHTSQRIQVPLQYMGVCQNYGPLWVP